MLGINAPLAERHLLMVMAAHGDYYGECALPRSRLVQLSGLADSTVKAALTYLVEHEVLELLDPGGGRGHPARYKIVH